MRISKARFVLSVAAIVGISGCQSSAPSSWFKFGKKDAAAESALADAPSHSRPSLPSSGASPSSLASNNTATWGTRPDTSAPAANSNWGTSWSNPGTSTASTAANVPASYNASTYPSTGMPSTAAVNNQYAQNANNWAAGSGAPAANTASATYQPQHGFYDANAYANQGAAQQYNMASQQAAASTNQYPANLYSVGQGGGNTVGSYNGYNGATGLSATTPQMVSNPAASGGAAPWSNSTGGHGDAAANVASNTYDAGAATSAATPAGYGASPGSAYGETQPADTRSPWGNNASGTYASGATVGSTYTPPAYNYSGASDSSGSWAVGGAGAPTATDSSSALPQRLGNYRPGGTGDYRPASGTALGATTPGSNPASTAAPANYESGLSQANPAATTVGGSASAGATSFR